MTTEYLVCDAESDLGEGKAYFEFRDGWAVRQVEQYGSVWLRSDTEHHASIGPGLLDQPLEELELPGVSRVTREEFERLWEHAGQGSAR